MFGMSMGRLGAVRGQGGISDIAAAIKALFANGGPFLWWEPDLNGSLFQDISGTALVTAVGQPVGLMPDKSGRVPELVVNGDFSNGLTGWTAQQGATLTDLGGSIRVTAGGLFSAAVVAIGTTIGKTYNLSGDVTGYLSPNQSVQSIRISDQQGSHTNLRNLNFYDVGPCQMQFVASASISYVWLDAQTIGSVVQYDNISVKPLGGLQASQPTAAARPVYSASPPSLVFDGVDDGLSTGAFPAGTMGSNMDCFIAVKRATDAKGILLTAGPGTSVGYFETSYIGINIIGAGSGGGQYVDGVLVPNTAADLSAAIGVGAWRIYEARGLDLSAWQSVRLSQYPGFTLGGSHGPVILCPAQSDANRTKIRQYMAAKVGVTLP